MGLVIGVGIDVVIVFVGVIFVGDDLCVVLFVIEFLRVVYWKMK